MTEALSITISPQVVTVEIADPNTLLTAADAVATAADRVQTGLDAISTNADAVATAADRVQTGLDVISTSALANSASLSAASIRVDAETFAAIPTLTTPCFVFVATDETNGNLPTVYFFDGSELQWVPSVGV